MTTAEIIGAAVGLLGAACSIAAVLVGLGRVLTRLDVIAVEHSQARAESKAQHEETRREIGSLREARIASEAAAEHLRADVNSAKESMRDIREELRAHTDARHKLRDDMHEQLANLRDEMREHVAQLRAEIERAAGASRASGR